MVMSQHSNRAARAGRAFALPGGLSAIAVFAAALTTAGLVASPAIAADYPARTVAGWTVAASKDGKGCFVTRDFAVNGGTSVLLGLDGDGATRLTLLNPHWSIAPREELRLTYRLTRGSYRDHAAVGIRSGDKRGFVSAFDAKFPAHFAASRALDVARGAVPVARLDLTGSGAAVTELRRCVAAQQGGQAPGASVGTGGNEDIPRDPFANRNDEDRGK